MIDVAKSSRRAPNIFIPSDTVAMCVRSLQYTFRLSYSKATRQMVRFALVATDLFAVLCFCCYACVAMFMNWYGRRLIHWNIEELKLEHGRAPYPLDHTQLHSMFMCFGHAYTGEPHLECGRRCVVLLFTSA